MAKTIYSYFTFLLSISFLLFSIETTEALKRSLSFELIYRYSPRSPIYNSSLTDSQYFEDSLHLSENRFLQLNNSEAMSVGYEITTIRPAITQYSSLYLVFLTIGTGNGTIGYYLEISTSTPLTWTQCKPCINCYPQNDPYFDPHQSPSFIDISCSPQNPCPQRYYHCINSSCHYHFGTVDGSYTKGTLSKDTFGFRSSHGDLFESVEGLVFGCSHDSQLLSLNHGYPAGLIALGLSEESFARQLINHNSQGRFSYCLPSRDSTSMSFLRFGDNIVQRGPVQTTSIVSGHGMCLYYIILNGISVDTKRLKFGSRMFARKSNGSGGFVVDFGIAFTQLITPAFEVVRKCLVYYFSRRSLHQVNPTSYGLSFKLCWLFQQHYQSFMPSMTFHLQGAEMSIVWQNVFYIVHQKGVFCFAMMPRENMTILGAYQQVNTRFTFDVLQLQLAFNPENCEHDSQP